MTRFTGMVAASIALVIAFNPAQAQDADELREQRRASQKERQLQKTERNRIIKDATKEFKDFARDLRAEYRDRINDLETQFELKRVELRAAHDAKVAEAEAEHHKKLAELLARQDAQLDESLIETLRAEAKAFSDELFQLRKEAAEALHRERVANDIQQNTVLTERDRLALEKAASLGLTQGYSPILATPVGDGLTPQEERWNEREREEVLRLEDRNAGLLNEFTSGEALREWEIKNLKEDFELEWEEKSELQALESQRYFYDALLAQSAKGGSFDQKKIANKMAELTKQKKLIEIRYKEIRDRNRIARREEKKELLAY